MKILLIGNELETPKMRAFFAQEGCQVETMSSRKFGRLPQGEYLVADAAFVARDHGHGEPFQNLRSIENIPFVAAVGADNITAGFSTLNQEDNAVCNEYILYGGEENLHSLIQFVKYKFGQGQKPSAPVPVALDSLYGMDGELYADVESYLKEAEPGYQSYVGILSYRTRWQGNDLAVERALKKALNERGIGVLTVFTTGRPDPQVGALSMEQVIRRFFMKDEELLIGLLVNFIFFGVVEEDGNSLFERTANFYNRLGIPVVRPLQSKFQTEEDWRASSAPFAKDAVSAFDLGELQGAIEPVYLGGVAGHKQHAVIEERAKKLAGRIAGWIALRKKENIEKKVAIIMNNAVCSGVEATLGRAAGLNGFESVVQLLRSLAAAGYLTGKLPESGEELRKRILDQKAYSDFRWTSAEDIQASGGVLYEMPTEEYERFYAQMPEKARVRMEEAWGTSPGEAMVLENKLLITGLRFGNILVMIQPKRGCYGAKCTGEVCKILQDPSCPPTHQYLATYFYADKVFGADALLHFGTHGSLEFLPGKANGMSDECFTDIAVGEKPNLYLYNSSGGAAALLAKRRTYAVLVDHEAKKEGQHVLAQNEMEAIIQGLNGGFILPGPCGGPEDEPVETGRNLYGIEIDKIPTKEAYDRGVQAADALVARYLEEEGKYPDRIAVNMISMDIMRTKGEQMSLFLSLLGVRPVWNSRGVVTGMECIPLEELGRPRMDVSSHITGVLRDAWPDILARMDEAVSMVAALEEPLDSNYVIKNLGDKKEEKELRIARIFGCAPGTYSNSIGLALKASAWKDENDLARYFIDSSSYVYGREKNGEKDVKAFLDGVERTDLTCDIMSLRHTDALKSSYSSRVQGGYALAAKMLGRKKEPRNFMGESGDKGIAFKTLREHLNDGLAQTLFNEDWKKQRMEAGYDGAADIMEYMQNVFDMQCMNEAFTSETLDEIAREYVMDEKMRTFMQENNPFAAEESARRMLELESRKKWQPAADIMDQLRLDYLKIEGNLEDGLNGRGEIQAGNVEIIADEAVAEWKVRLEAADKEIKQWKKQNC